MEAAALLAAGWAVQAEASCPVIPPTAPAMTATSRSSSAATAATVTVAEPRSAAGGGIRERLLQELPAPAGSMSHTSQPEPAGVRVTAQAAEDRLVPLLLVMTWAAVAVTVTEPGVRSADRQRGHGRDGRLAGGGALGEDAAVARGLGEGGFQRGGGHRLQRGRATRRGAAARTRSPRRR